MARRFAAGWKERGLRRPRERPTTAAERERVRLGTKATGGREIGISFLECTMYFFHLH